MKLTALTTNYARGLLTSTRDGSFVLADLYA